MTGYEAKSNSISLNPSTKVKQNTACSLKELEGCLSKLKDVTENNQLAFASTRRDLHEACR